MSKPPAWSSRPLRARGLKLQINGGIAGPDVSRPLRARGLKPQTTRGVNQLIESRPLRARGLKPGRQTCLGLSRCVAPPAGAWIET